MGYACAVSTFVGFASDGGFMDDWELGEVAGEGWWAIPVI